MMHEKVMFFSAVYFTNTLNILQGIFNILKNFRSEKFSWGMTELDKEGLLNKLIIFHQGFKMEAHFLM